MIDIDITHDMGGFKLAACVKSEGPVTALFGPSGAGKTSLLNMIAGLVKPQSGRITFGDTVLVDSKTGTFVPPHKRRFGYIFQDARLFPHLDVQQNLNFGARFSSAQKQDSFDQVVSLLGIAKLLSRAPASLSGGEKQRVAIGRALLSNPKLLLMDEPLAALDDERKDEVLSYIERISTTLQTPIVYVSHSVPEIVRLATHVAYLKGGRLEAFGPLQAMLANVGTGFVEPSVVLDAVVQEADPHFGLATVQTPAGPLEILRPGATSNQRLRLRILASDVMLATKQPQHISAQNILSGTISTMVPVPGSANTRLDVTLRCNETTIIARITAKAAQKLMLKDGAPALAIIKSVAIE